MCSNTRCEQTVFSTNTPFTISCVHPAFAANSSLLSASLFVCSRNSLYSLCRCMDKDVVDSCPELLDLFAIRYSTSRLGNFDSSPYCDIINWRRPCHLLFIVVLFRLIQIPSAVVPRTSIWEFSCFIFVWPPWHPIFSSFVTLPPSTIRFLLVSRSLDWIMLRLHWS